jgi:hypothetical protein
MPSSVLYFGYLAVMTAAMVCFLQAFRVRFDTPRHKRWGVTGVLVSLGGIVVVLLGASLWGWTVDQRWPGVILWHRRLAYVGTALILLIGVSGALRWRIHTRLYLVFLPVYALVLLLAILGYEP